MLYFENDYSEGAHELIMKKLCETAREKLLPYGSDKYSVSAREKIRVACNCPGADIYFLAGGTQTNQVVIDSLLEPFEGAMAARTGHIALHEAGAIEFTGHKVIELPQTDGKLNADTIRTYRENFYSDGSNVHMVRPGLVYLSQPTEYGTLYSKKELEAISAVCRKFDLRLYVDGARLGYALASKENDVSLADLAELCDAFYIGGTKVGALCGEAVVFPRKTPSFFFTRIKQHGALFAKGRITGVQFDVLFTDGLYYKLGQHAMVMAETLTQALRDKKYRFFIESPTNQIFVIMENARMEELQKNVRFTIWEKYDERHTTIRLVTSWATEQKDLDALISLL